MTSIFPLTVFGFPLMRLNWSVQPGAIRTQQSVYEGTLFTKDGVSNFYRIQNNNLLDEMTHWVECCQDNRTDPDLTIEDARRVIELCLACRESAQTHTPVTLPLGED